MPSNDQVSEQAGGKGPLGAIPIPWIVLAMAALPALAALLLGTVGAVISAVTFEEPFDRLGFPVIVALLTGQEVALAAGGEAFGYGGSGRVGLRFLPLGLVTLSAAVLLRVSFTRAWMSVRQAAWLPPVCGVVGTAVVAVIGMIAASFAGIDVGFARAGLQVRFSLIGLLLVGAGPWLLAQLAVRWPVVRNLLYGMVGLQLLLVLLVTGSAVLNGPEGSSGGEQTAYLLFTFLASVVWSLNLLVALLWWPFVGALGMGGSVGSVLSIAGEAPRLGFLEAAGEQPFLWLAPILAVAGVVAAMWFLPAPTSWADVRNRVGRFTLGIGVLVLPALWAGRLRIAGSGDIAGELVEEATWFLGFGGIGGDARAQVDVTFGAIGLPIRFLPALLIWAGLAALVSVLVAQRAGAQWADSGVIASDARKAGGSLAARARAAAEAAQRAAAAAQTQPDQPAGAEAPRAVDSPRPATEDVPSASVEPRPEPRPAPAGNQLASPDGSVPEAVDHAPTSDPAPSTVVPPSHDDVPSWQAAPPPMPEQRRPNP
jgi:hypothetical protein